MPTKTLGRDKDIYLALSGGGFRASGYHLGILLALLSRNLHHSLRFVNGVSGGAITAAYFGYWWNAWKENDNSSEGTEALRSFAAPSLT